MARDQPALDRRERLLVHQIHPAKLATDISVAIVSTALFWRRRPVLGLLVVAVPPPIASALAIRGDLSRCRNSAAGRYVLAHMPVSMMAVRSVGALVMAVGGQRRSRGLVATGIGLVALGWSHGPLVRLRRRLGPNR